MRRPYIPFGNPKCLMGEVEMAGHRKFCDWPKGKEVKGPQPRVTRPKGGFRLDIVKETERHLEECEQHLRDCDFCGTPNVRPRCTAHGECLHCRIDGLEDQLVKARRELSDYIEAELGKEDEERAARARDSGRTGSGDSS